MGIEVKFKESVKGKNLIEIIKESAKDLEGYKVTFVNKRLLDFTSVKENYIYSVAVHKRRSKASYIIHLLIPIVGWCKLFTEGLNTINLEMDIAPNKNYSKIDIRTYYFSQPEEPEDIRFNLYISNDLKNFVKGLYNGTEKVKAIKN